MIFGDTFLLGNAIERILWKCVNENQFVEINVFQKKYCVNLVISRIFPLKHKSTVSLDIVVSVKMTTKVQEFFREYNSILKCTSFKKSTDIEMIICIGISNSTASMTVELVQTFSRSIS